MNDIENRDHLDDLQLLPVDDDFVMNVWMNHHYAAVVVNHSTIVWIIFSILSVNRKHIHDNVLSKLIYN